MIKYKANIVKLDKMIVYQPSYLDLDVYSKIVSCGLSSSSFYYKNKYNDQLIYFCGNPSISNGTIYLGLSCSTNVISSGQYTTGGAQTSFMRFASDEERDIFFNKLLDIIKVSIVKLEELIAENKTDTSIQIYGHQVSDYDTWTDSWAFDISDEDDDEF